MTTTTKKKNDKMTMTVGQSSSQTSSVFGMVQTFFSFQIGLFVVSVVTVAEKYDVLHPTASPAADCIVVFLITEILVNDSEVSDLETAGSEMS